MRVIQTPRTITRSCTMAWDTSTTALDERLRRCRSREKSSLTQVNSGIFPAPAPSIHLTQRCSTSTPPSGAWLSQIRAIPFTPSPRSSVIGLTDRTVVMQESLTMAKSRAKITITPNGNDYGEVNANGNTPRRFLLPGRSHCRRRDRDPRRSDVGVCARRARCPDSIQAEK